MFEVGEGYAHTHRTDRFTSGAAGKLSGSATRRPYCLILSRRWYSSPEPLLKNLNPYSPAKACMRNRSYCCRTNRPCQAFVSFQASTWIPVLLSLNGPINPLRNQKAAPNSAIAQ